MMKILAMAVALLAICAFGTAHAALITNGGLKGTAFQSPFASLSLSAGSASIPNWAVGGGGTDWVDTHWQDPVSGQYSINLDSGKSTQGTISQTLTTTPTQWYEVTFALSGDPDGGPGTMNLKVSAAGASEGFSYTVTGSNSDTNMEYITEAFFFQATGTSTTLTFTSTDTAGSADGAVIGDVVADPVPLPAGLLLFAPGLAGLVIGKKRLNR